MNNINFTKANLGMYAETIVLRSCDYYHLHEIAYIEKRQLPIKIIKKINENTIIGKLLSKSYVDFFGSYNGKHIEFEVKETINEYFSLALLKTHQFEYLKTISHHNISCFLIVYFSKFDEFYRIDFKWLLNFVESNKSKNIPYQQINKNATLLKIVYPGIINFLDT